MAKIAVSESETQNDHGPLAGDNPLSVKGFEQKRGEKMAFLGCFLEGLRHVLFGSKNAVFIRQR